MVPKMEFDVGAHLRELRKKSGLSQRELARCAGVTHAAVSLVERNKANPSVSLLKKVVQGLDVSLAEFFSGKNEIQDSIFYRKDDLFTLMNGPITLQQVGSDLRGNLLQFIIMRFEPGADTGEEKYAHEGEEGGLIMQGRVELTVGDETQVLEVGDAFHFDSNIPHRYRNVGKEVCVVFTAGTPPSF